MCNCFRTGWTGSQLHTSKMKHPVSQNIAACWMREAGFCCCGHKKLQCVDRLLEDTDVNESPNAHVANSFNEESYEHCWVQLTRKVCLTMKERKKREKLAERTKVKQMGMKKTLRLEQCIHMFVAVERHLDSKAHHCTGRSRNWRGNGRSAACQHRVFVQRGGRQITSRNSSTAGYGRVP
jgi:hypothetical protein